MSHGYSDEENKLLHRFASTLQAKKVKLVVFDMDNTMVGQHSHGAVQENKLSCFQESVSNVVKKLIPFLLEQNFQVGVATLSDDLYTILLHQRSTAPVKYVSGRELVIKTLGTFLNKEQLDHISPHIVTLNPALYHRRQYGLDGDEEEAALRTYFFDKLKSLGVIKSAGDEKADQCYRFPPKPYKNHHLQILRVLTKHDYNAMILLDDKEENVTQARGLGAYGLHVEGKDALEWADLQRFLKTEASTYSRIERVLSKSSSGSKSKTMDTSRTSTESTDETGKAPLSDSSSSSSSSKSMSVADGESHTKAKAFSSDSTTTAAAVATHDRWCRVCNREATKRCARCHAAYYCSPQCQRKDWFEAHRSECSAVSR